MSRHPKLDELEAAMVEVLRVSAELSVETPVAHPVHLYASFVNATTSAMHSSLRGVPSTSADPTFTEACAILDAVSECLPTPDVSPDIERRIGDFLYEHDRKRARE